MDLHTKPQRHRSKAACQFCRTRKLKCDNLEPECSACKARGIRCEYVIRAPAPRPSNAAIHALQRENGRLRRLLESKGVTGIDDGREDEDAMDEDVMDSRRASLASPTFDHTKQHNDPGNVFDPQLQNVGPSPARMMTGHSFVPDHQSPRWQDLGRIDPVISSFDDNTRGVLRSQLVAVSARQRMWPGGFSSTGKSDTF